MKAVGMMVESVQEGMKEARFDEFGSFLEQPSFVYVEHLQSQLKMKHLHR